MSIVLNDFLNLLFDFVLGSGPLSTIGSYADGSFSTIG